MVHIRDMLFYKLKHEAWSLDEVKEYSGLEPQTIVDVLVGNLQGYYPEGGIVDLWLDMTEQEAKEQRIKADNGQEELF